MLYEEALYTVLYRAGTMGPDQVDDQEALLSYLQQVSPLGRNGTTATADVTANHLNSTHVCTMYTTYTYVYVHRQTRIQADWHPRRMGTYTHTHRHTKG